MTDNDNLAGAACASPISAVERRRRRRRRRNWLRQQYGPRRIWTSRVRAVATVATLVVGPLFLIYVFFIHK